MFSILIDLSNQAFESRAELARVLKQVAILIEHGHALPGDTGRIRDINGNTAGHWTWSINGKQTDDSAD